MMKPVARLVVGGSASLAWPAHAQAQQIHPIWVALALSPLLAVLLSVALGIVLKSWRIGLGSVALVVIWVAWFMAASEYCKSDWITWAPLVGLGFHLLALVGGIVLRGFQKASIRDNV